MQESSRSPKPSKIYEINECHLVPKVRNNVLLLHEKKGVENLGTPVAVIKFNSSQALQNFLERAHLEKNLSFYLRNLKLGPEITIL